jgi:tight adherence protein B
VSPQAIAIIVFVGTLAVVFGVGYFFIALMGSERVVVEKRFKKLSSHIDMPGYQEQALTFLKKETDWRQYSMFSDFPPLLNLPILFEQAGMTMDVGRWLLLVMCFSIAATSMAFLAKLSLIKILCVAFVSLLIPYVLILHKRNKRIRGFEVGLAQTLEILGRSMRSGHPLTMGLQMVSMEMPEPIRTEFGRVFYEQQMGLPFDDSLKRMAQRVPLLDLRFFVLSVLIHQQTGGDLAEVLDNLSRVIRERFKVLGQVKALTAEGRLSGWVLSALPVVVFLIINMMNPGYIKTLTDSELGMKMLYGAGVLQIIGMLIIQKIVRIKV